MRGAVPTEPDDEKAERQQYGTDDRQPEQQRTLAAGGARALRARGAHSIERAPDAFEQGHHQPSRRFGTPRDEPSSHEASAPGNSMNPPRRTSQPPATAPTTVSRISQAGSPPNPGATVATGAATTGAPDAGAVVT